MKFENVFLVVGGFLIILYFIAENFKSPSFNLHLYDTYYVINLSAICGGLLVISILDFVAYKFLRFQFGNPQSQLMILQITFALLFFGFMILSPFLRKPLKDSYILFEFVLLVVSQTLLLFTYFLQAYHSNSRT